MHIFFEDIFHMRVFLTDIFKCVFSYASFMYLCIFYVSQNILRLLEYIYPSNILHLIICLKGKIKLASETMELDCILWARE